MTALYLLRQAIALLAQSPIKTVKVVGPALTLLVIVSIMIAFAAPELLAIGTSSVDLERPPLSWTSMALLLAFIVSYALMAILWHRHTLGQSGARRPLTAPLVFGYLWRVGVLALIQIAVSLAIIVPLVLASVTAGGGVRPAIPSVLIATFISQLLLVWLSLRLSLILPAAAIGEPIRMKQSWDYTYPLGRALWGVAAALALLNTSMRALVVYMGLENPAFMLALQLPIYVFKGLLVLSVLTTLYALQLRKTPS